MRIRFTRRVVLELYSCDEDGDHCEVRTFREGEVYQVGEVSEVDDELDVIEFVGLGYAEVPNDTWIQDSNLRFSFSPSTWATN